MTRAEAKKRILQILLIELTNDDESLFGPEAIEGTQDYAAFDAARQELFAEFRRRSDH